MFVSLSRIDVLAALGVVAEFMCLLLAAFAELIRCMFLLF